MQLTTTVTVSPHGTVGLPSAFMAPPRHETTPGANNLISRPVPALEAERRLRPVLDVLYDGDNPRQALKIASQAESKRPGWPAARALRALALLRMGKDAEGLATAQKVLDDLEQGIVPADEDAAAKLHLFYRELPRREHMSARAYEIVARRDESDVHISETSFMYHIRARDFSGAQKIATRLQRHAPPLSAAISTQRPREEYAIWAVISLWLSNRGPLKNPKLDALVPALLKRAVQDIPVPSAEVTRIATRLFCDSGDFDAASSLLGVENIVIDSSELAHLQADVSFRARNTSRAVEAYRALLADGDSEDWGHWLRYIELASHSDVFELIQNLSSKNRGRSVPSRGLLLAEMEIHFRKRDFPALRHALVHYFESCGAMSICSLDLKPYALGLAFSENGAMDRDASEILCRDLEESTCDESCRGTNENLARRHLTISWLRLWLDCFAESPEELFARHRALIVDNLESTERQPGDDYLLLAAHQLLPGMESERYVDGIAIMKAIILIEAGLTRSPFNFHFKLLLIRLYSKVGAIGRVFDIWNTLDVKHVQIATLGHILVRPLFYHGFFLQWNQLNDLFRRFWLECERDIPESVSRAFCGGSVNAAVEFIEFRDKLERCATSIEAVLCEALQHLCSGLEDAAALEAAWGVVGDESRLSLSWFVPPNELFSCEDETVMEFWDLELYKSDRCRDDLDRSDSRDRKCVSQAIQGRMLVEFVIMRCFIRILRGPVTATELDMTRENDAVASAPGCDGAIRSDLNALQQGAAAVEEAKQANAQTRYLVSLLHTTAGVFELTFSDSDSHDIVRIDDADVGYLEDILNELRAESIGTGLEKPCLSPLSLSKAGQYIHETLTLTAAAVKVLSKLSLHRPPPTSPASQLTNWKRAKAIAKAAARKYSSAAGTACRDLLDLIAPVVDVSDARGDWTRIWAGIGQLCPGHDLVTFLPDGIPCSNTEAKTDEDSLTREEFQESVIDAISVSHMQSCSNIMHSLNSISPTFALTSI